MDDLLTWLQRVFANDLSNGSWEHEHGVNIFTVDNPGWYFKFDLRNTVFEEVLFNEVSVEKDEKNWYKCKFEAGIFYGMGGPENLINILTTFKDWYTQSEQFIDSIDAN